MGWRGDGQDREGSAQQGTRRLTRTRMSMRHAVLMRVIERCRRSAEGQNTQNGGEHGPLTHSYLARERKRPVVDEDRQRGLTPLSAPLESTCQSSATHDAHELGSIVPRTHACCSCESSKASFARGEGEEGEEGGANQKRIIKIQASEEAKAGAVDAGGGRTQAGAGRLNAVVTGPFAFGGRGFPIRPMFLVETSASVWIRSGNRLGRWERVRRD